MGPFDPESFDRHTNLSHWGVPKSRVWIVGGFFAFLIFLIMIRLCIVCMKPMGVGDPGPKQIVRATILDRNGYILASSLQTFSVYAHPNKIIHKAEAIQSLIKIFPHLNTQRLEADLHSKKSFVWIIRHIAPHNKMAVKALGIQGLDILNDSKRIYHHDRMFSHVLGTTDLDQKGMSGLELGMNDRLMQSDEPLWTSLDLRVQHILHDALSTQIKEFQAVGGNGIILDLTTGEILAMVSLPDFSPLEPLHPLDPSYFNRNMSGVYEFGSIMKIVNTALLLDHDKGTLRSIFDATHPLYIGRHKVTDFKGQKRPLTVEEAFIYSSNIAHAKMAVASGGPLQKQFFEKMGFSKAIKTELGYCARPLMPSGKWPLARIMTAGYGYGFAVTPLHVAASLIPLATGYKKPVTFLAQSRTSGPRILKASTVKDVMYLMGQAVSHVKGQSKRAAANNCIVGSKTGTANVRIGGKYAEKQNLTSSVAVFPLNKPRYGIVLSLDRAKPSSKTYGYATAGWFTAPLISRVVQEIAPLLGVMSSENKEIERSVKK